MNGINNNYIDINVNHLLSMGFNREEINNLIYVRDNGGKFTPSALQSYGYNYEQAKRLAYMANICKGKVNIESKDQMTKHLKKMFGTGHRINIHDLETSSINNVPRIAVIDNLVQAPYSIWNSKNYKGKEALYKVIDVTGQRITIETPRKPRLEYRQAKELPGILEIKGVRANGNCVVSFDKKYCKLCNRFVIVASLRRPERHLGMYEVICIEGTKIYIYATSMGIREQVRYSMGTQRIYDYGIFPQDIKGKLDLVAKQIYKRFSGVSVSYENPIDQYKVIEVTHQIDEIDNVDI